MDPQTILTPPTHGEFPDSDSTDLLMPVGAIHDTTGALGMVDGFHTEVHPESPTHGEF